MSHTKFDMNFEDGTLDTKELMQIQYTQEQMNRYYAERKAAKAKCGLVVHTYEEHTEYFLDPKAVLGHVEEVFFSTT